MGGLLYLSFLSNGTIIMYMYMYVLSRELLSACTFVLELIERDDIAFM